MQCVLLSSRPITAGIGSLTLIASQNHFAFSPNPWFIAAFFSGQVVLQLAWIRKLFVDDPPNGYQAIAQNAPSAASHEGSAMQPVSDKEDERAWKVALSYALVYAIGNLCIGASYPFHPRTSSTGGCGG